MKKEITGWEKWELEFEKFVDESLNGYAKWYPEADPITVQKFISQAIASAVEAREREISEAVNEMKSSFEKAGIKKQWEVTDEDRSSGSYNYIESGFLGGYQTAKQDILSIINPSKE